MNTTFGRAVALIALVVGPLSLVVGNIAQWMLQPSGESPTATDAAAQFPTAWLVIGLLGVFGPIVWLGGIPSAVSLAERRGALVTRIGGLLTGAGLAAGIGHVALFFGLYGALAQAGLGDDAAARMEGAAEQELLGNILLVAFLVGFSLGPIVLTVGLRIARVVGVWVPIAAVLTAGANLFGGPIAGVVQLITLVLVWAPIVVAVARHAERSTIHRNADVGAPA